MDFAVFSNNFTAFIHQDRRIKTANSRRIFKFLGIAQVEAHAVLSGFIKQRTRDWARHFRLEPPVHMLPILVIPAREEGRQRQLREYEHLNALGVRPVHKRQHPRHNCFPAVR